MRITGSLHPERGYGAVAVIAIVVGYWLAGPTAFAANAVTARLDAAIASSDRPAAEHARDRYRHPKETLMFFGLEPGMTVVEIWPAQGWYTAIVAPVLKDRGRYYGAQYATADPDGPRWMKSVREKYIKRFVDHPERYGHITVTAFDPPDHAAIAPPGSVDMVLTFRNVHNWAAKLSDGDAFKAFYKALKPGGILGVVEHRAQPGTSSEDMIRTGYMTEDYVIRLAEQAGFKLLAKSEINANPKDTRDHPNGVWSLPPTLRGCRPDCARYLAIGESDRMTLKFVKPSSSQ